MTSAKASGFTGIPAEAFDFYARLAADNTRAWWSAHRHEYESFIREPMTALLAELEAEFGSGHLYRPHRDTRFSPDKSPLKDHQGAVVQIEDSVGYYVQVSAAGLMVAGGWYAPQGAQIDRYRKAVDGPAGAELEQLVARLVRTFDMDGQSLKTAPRGYPADHNRIGLLRHRALTVARRYGPSPWMGTRTALRKVRDDWRAMRPLLEWLADHIGPGLDPELDGEQHSTPNRRKR